MASHEAYHSFDLKQRTQRFGETAIDLAKAILKNPVNQSLISQFVRAATSVGANYMEADAAESKKDFQHKLSISRKEAKETMHWCQMLARSNPEKISDFRRIWQEAHELVLIFSSSIKSSKK